MPHLHSHTHTHTMIIITNNEFSHANSVSAYNIITKHFIESSEREGGGIEKKRQRGREETA